MYLSGVTNSLHSSVVVDNLRSLRHNIGVACLYCDYKDQNNQTLVHILGTFLRQFLTATQEPIPIPEEVVQKLSHIQRQGAKVRAEDNLALLKLQLQRLKRAFICIDAVDELEPRVRRELLTVLKELGTNNTRLFLTGRGHIESEVQTYFPVEQRDAVVISARQQDIQEFVRQQIEKDHSLNPEAIDDVLAKDIEDAIVNKSQGMYVTEVKEWNEDHVLIHRSRFLLPTLHIKMVLGFPTKSKRRKALEKLPPGLYGSFQELITRIREYPSIGQAELGMQVLMWLHFAYRPLKLAELQHALAIEPNDTEFDADNIPSQKALLDCCLGLVQVDEETSIVRLVHYTLEEYLVTNTKAEFPNGYSYIAETCLTYLNFGKIRQHCASLDSLKRSMHDYIFLNYATLYWGTHVKEQYSDNLTKLTTMFVDHETERPYCGIQALYFKLDQRWHQSIARKFSGIHVLAYFGLSGHMAYLYKEKRQMELQDETGRTPLSWAAEYGHDSVVRLLIERDVDINVRDKDGRGPLSWAVQKGHEAVARLLIESNKVDINAKDERGRTPLSWAASERGSEVIVRLLIERDGVDINSRDGGGWTPLLWAVKEGNEAVVRLLIEKDDINTQGHDGWTPLLLAASKGHKDILRLLIERGDIDINATDKNGWTPLSLAAEYGFEDIVQLLIHKEKVDINAKDKDGRTALSLVAEVGHGAVVQLLVERGDVDLNAKDKFGWTPLFWATKEGNESVVRLLTGINDVDINTQDHDGQSLLAVAAVNGHEALVQLLVEKDDVDINIKDNRGWTPLSVAAARGQNGVVRLLIERGVDINAKAKNGLTPLSMAAMQGHEAIVQLLVERGDVQINAGSTDGLTALSCAAGMGHKSIVQLLVEREDININAKDRDGLTPLSYAAGMGQEPIVQLLVERGDVDINARDSHGQTPLSHAAAEGHEAVVRLLVGKGGVYAETEMGGHP